MKFIKCKFNSIKKQTEKNIKEFHSPIDEYLEERIIDSDHYKIYIDAKYSGFCSVYKGKTIIQFWIKEFFRKKSQEVFQQVKNLDKVEKALVPTCDEYFLVHALDNFRKLEKRGYFFQDNKNFILAKDIFLKLKLNLSKKKDILLIKEEDRKYFKEFSNLATKKQVFNAILNDKIVGYGVLIKHKILRNYASIGMYTKENQRQKGIGKNIIYALKKKVYKLNLKPVAGCYYYNHNSKRTLESAGMYAHSRLLKIYF